MKKIVSSVGLIAGGLLAALPFVASAQSNAGSAGTGIIGQGTQVVQAAGNFVNQAIYTLNLVIAALITIAVIVFIWSIIKFIYNKDAEAQKTAKSQMLWSVIAIAVIIGIFGIARLLLSTFGVGGGGLQGNEIPTVPTATYGSPSGTTYGQ